MSFSEQEMEEFKAEAFELLDIAEKSLLALDDGAEYQPAFDAVFRCFHNVKGAAGMMELTQLQGHTHELETIFMGFKSATKIPKEYISMFLRGIDAARSMFDGKAAPFNYDVALGAMSASPPKDHAPATEVAPTLSLAQEMTDATLSEFVSECEDAIERISANLQSVESGSYLKDAVDELYRDVHSLKGSAYLFSFTKLGDVGHAMESSLEKIRDGSVKPSERLLNSMYQSLRLIETLVLRIKQKVSDEDLMPTVSEVSKALREADLNQLSDSGPRPKGTEMPNSKNPELVIPEAKSEKVDESQGEVVVGSPKEREAEGASSIRVPVALLDNLMTLMGEMVLVRNQVLQFSNKSEDLDFLSMSKRLNVVTSEIQGEMMKTRMQPIGNVFSKFNRLVRDLSHELKKNLTLNLSGSETELDKSLLEAIKDPLTHIVRNSCDHGVETPEVRRAMGKPEGGTISIKAYHEGGQVVIEVSDDGKGLHKEVLIKKAIEKGLLTQAQTSKMSEKEIFNLIFAPGFSTAAKVTNVSGRGVGMDVVRTNIERIGGTVDLSSVAGVKTSIKIKIPLTLAIVPALIIKGGNEAFAIPQVKLEELVRVDQASTDHKIEILHGAPVYRLRGNILPLVDLNKVLGIQKNEMTNYDHAIVNIAVLNAERCSFGLIIDEVQDTADIVVKPLNRLLKSLHVYSGATVMGDGSIALILDVLGLSKVAQIGHEKIKDGNADVQKNEKSRKVLELQDFLLLRLNSPTKHALVLSYVNRLEEFETKNIEISGSQRVIRYRDVILPLISANEQLGYPARPALTERVPVVVIERAGTLYGIEVDEILDTLSTTAGTDTGHSQHPCIFGNLNTKEELIVIVDPFELIISAFPEPIINLPVITAPHGLVSQAPSSTHPVLQEVLQQASAQSAGGLVMARVLLVEDTVFFRRAIQEVLEKGGFEVVTAVDGREALELLNKDDFNVDLIVSDIEMPRLNGFELAKSVRRHPRFANLPMLAISSRADRKHVTDGATAGFNGYLEKLRPAPLLAAVHNLLTKKVGAA